jgi:hypothetical protein
MSRPFSTQLVERLRATHGDAIPPIWLKWASLCTASCGMQGRDGAKACTVYACPGNRKFTSFKRLMDFVHARLSLDKPPVDSEAEVDELLAAAQGEEGAAAGNLEVTDTTERRGTDLEEQKAAHDEEMRAQKAAHDEEISRLWIELRAKDATIERHREEMGAARAARKASHEELKRGVKALFARKARDHEAAKRDELAALEARCRDEKRDELASLQSTYEAAILAEKKAHDEKIRRLWTELRAKEATIERHPGETEAAVQAAVKTACELMCDKVVDKVGHACRAMLAAKDLELALAVEAKDLEHAAAVEAKDKEHAAAMEAMRERFREAILAADVLFRRALDERCSDFEHRLREEFVRQLLDFVKASQTLCQLGDDGTQPPPPKRQRLDAMWAVENLPAAEA